MKRDDWPIEPSPNVQGPETSGTNSATYWAPGRGELEISQALKRTAATYTAVNVLTELVPRDPIDHEAERRLGLDRVVGFRGLERRRREPLLLGQAVEAFDARRLEVRVEERHKAERGSAHRKVDRGANLFSLRLDRFEGRDGVGRSERGRSSSRRERDLGVGTDHGDRRDGRLEGEEGSIVLEQDDGVRRRLAEERAQFGRVDLVFARVEWNLGINRKVDELEHLRIVRGERSCSASGSSRGTHSSNTLVEIFDEELLTGEGTVDLSTSHDGRSGHFDVQTSLSKKRNRSREHCGN